MEAWRLIIAHEGSSDQWSQIAFRAWIRSRIKMKSWIRTRIRLQVLRISNLEMTTFTLGPLGLISPCLALSVEAQIVPAVSVIVEPLLRVIVVTALVVVVQTWTTMEIKIKKLSHE
jgi:hypothetical protein